MDILEKNNNLRQADLPRCERTQYFSTLTLSLGLPHCSSPIVLDRPSSSSSGPATHVCSSKKTQTPATKHSLGIPLTLALPSPILGSMSLSSGILTASPDLLLDQVAMPFLLFCTNLQLLSSSLLTPDTMRSQGNRNYKFYAPIRRSHSATQRSQGKASPSLGVPLQIFMVPSQKEESHVKRTLQTEPS